MRIRQLLLAATVSALALVPVPSSANTGSFILGYVIGSSGHSGSSHSTPNELSDNVLYSASPETLEKVNPLEIRMIAKSVSLEPPYGSAAGQSLGGMFYGDLMKGWPKKNRVILQIYRIVNINGNGEIVFTYIERK